ncbi:MAG: hypothetical protein D6781_04180 [Verrucomicrobia bacterium]|nr:MAG: hypothetical protein D6781_04180 [Verrucomicrobiota bacterium]
MPRALETLEQRWSAAPASPVDRGRVVQVCVRPDLDRRMYPEVLELCPLRGAVGDRWERRTWMYLPDGRPDPRVQVAVANWRMIEFVQRLAGSDHHPGDTLLVDLDLGADNLPVGVQVRVGTAVIEVSDVENGGCAKFAQHFGEEVLRWIRLPDNRTRRLRGLFARVVSAGTVRAGDVVCVQR